LSSELGSKITIAKLNIDENPNVPMKYGVKSIPTLMIFKNGQVAATKIGQLSKQRLKEWIDSTL
jgi:thioredoxin 1